MLIRMQAGGRDTILAPLPPCPLECRVPLAHATMLRVAVQIRPENCRVGRDYIMRLKIELPTAWRKYNNPKGPATFCRQGSTNAFQVSWAEYSGGTIPNPSVQSLQQTAAGFGHDNGFGEMVDSSGGACRFGIFGTAVFCSAQHPRIQVWFITDGRDHIMATHICDREPNSSEIAEVQRIASSLALGPEQRAKPWWKFW